MVNRSIQAKILKMKRRGKKKVWTKAFVNSGKGPNQERMSEYYSRVHSMTGGDNPLLQSKLEVVLKDVPREQKIVMVDDTFATLALYFRGTEWFFVEIDKRKESVRRSIVYSNKRIAVAVMSACCITWVERKFSKSITT